MSTPSRADRRDLVLLGGLLLLALVLRAVGAGHGLPYPLLDPDETNIVPRAWAVIHEGALDPRFYDYPSLLVYLVAPFELLADTPSYGAARILAVALGVGGVATAWWLGRRAYGRDAAILGAAAVAVATIHVAYSRVAVTDVLLTLAITCALALVLSGRVEWAGVAVGVAASAKYPGAVAAVPVVIAAWGVWRRLARAAALALAVFVATSPFVVVHAGEAWDDVTRVGRLARSGWLGFEDDPTTAVAFLDRLWGGLGPFLLLTVAGVGVAVVRRTRTDLVLASFVAAWFLTLLPVDAHFDRYVLPLVPVLAVLAATVPRSLPVGLVLLLVPLVWSIGDARDLAREDTRVAAAAWVDANIPAGDLIAAESSTLPLTGRPVERLDVPGPDRDVDPDRDVEALRAQGVRWILVSGAVADRVLAARDRYPKEAAFYDDLARSRPVFESLAGDGRSGPWIRVYRL